MASKYTGREWEVKKSFASIDSSVCVISLYSPSPSLSPCTFPSFPLIVYLLQTPPSQSFNVLLWFFFSFLVVCLTGLPAKVWFLERKCLWISCQSCFGWNIFRCHQRISSLCTDQWNRYECTELILDSCFWFIHTFICMIYIPMLHCLVFSWTLSVPPFFFLW